MISIRTNTSIKLNKQLIITQIILLKIINNEMIIEYPLSIILTTNGNEIIIII